MIDRKTKLRFRRNVRKGKRQVEDMSVQAEEHLERLFIRRLHRLIQVRRFVLTWIVLIVLLISGSIFQLRNLSKYYLSTSPTSGGVFTEGVIGSFTNANPLYANGGVDGGVSRLIFSSLLDYSNNGELENDLATGWKVNESGKVYTVTIRTDAKWHDGEPLTVDDIIFTYKMIQNPDAQSPLFSAWRDVRVTTTGPDTIVFTLPNVFAAFPYSMTNGIIPKHILKDVKPDQLRADQFNTVKPIGSGPFAWERVEVSGQIPEERQEQIALRRNQFYYQGVPKLQRFVIKTFRSEEVMLREFEQRNLSAMSGLASVSDSINASTMKKYSLPLTGVVMVFFKTSEGVLQDKAVRKALVQSVDVGSITDQLLNSVVRADSPLLRGQLGYDKALTQLGYNVELAKKHLDDAGWKLTGDGFREKEGVKLQFSLKAPNTSEYAVVTSNLQEFWRAIGVKVDVDQPSDTELQSIVSLHQYDAVAYSISIGKDPDVFAFWHSSQADIRADSRLNLSEYNSKVVDQSLESGRTRTDPELRKVKYQPFLKAWIEDAPALALYQPQYLYVVRGELDGFNSELLNGSNDRYTNVHNWTIRSKKVYKN